MFRKRGWVAMASQHTERTDKAGSKAGSKAKSKAGKRAEALLPLGSKSEGGHFFL